MNHAPLLQSDPRLASEPSLKQYGCLVSSLRILAERDARKVLSPVEVLDMYRWLVNEGHVKDEGGKRAWVENHAAVINAAFFYLGEPQTAEYLWRMDLAGQGGDFGSPHDCDGFIAQARIKGWAISHFYVADSKGERVFDPFWPYGEVERLVSIRGYAL